MVRPQFTLRTLFVCVSYLALGCGCLRASLLIAHGEPKFLLFNAGVAVVGAGIGVLVDQRVRGAVYALVLVYLVVILNYWIMLSF